MSEWTPKIGVTVGKFKPFHRGHELMISMAAAELKELTVIVADSEDGEYDGDLYIPLSYRYNMVKQALKHLDNVRVVKHIDTYGDAKKYDEHGTAVDEDFWAYWTNVFTMLAPDANYFVSSDRYGHEAARRLTMVNGPRHGVEWFPVDPDRELFDISATRIRQDPFGNWKYIHPMFRQLFGKRILVIGPESSGKSTLVRELGKALSSPAVPEYGRILSEMHQNELTEEHFEQIVKRHHEMELFAIRNSETGLAISDTDVFTTYLFSEVYLPDSGMESIRRKCNINWYDLVIILPPELEWYDDGTRVMEDQADREKFFHLLCAEYQRHPNTWVLNHTPDLKDRFDIVCSKVAEMIKPDAKIRDTGYESLTKHLEPVTMIE